LFEFVRQTSNQTEIVEEPMTLQQEKQKLSKFLQNRQSMSKDEKILCRICEELIGSNIYEEHSKTCAIRLKVDAKCIENDETLKKVVVGLKKKNKDSASTLGTKDAAIMKNLERYLTITLNASYEEVSIAEFDSLLAQIQEIKKEVLNHVRKKNFKFLKI
jgi:hypothetical protein